MKNAVIGDVEVKPATRRQIAQLSDAAKLEAVDLLRLLWSYRGRIACSTGFRPHWFE
jgi:hypothetical protein